MKLLKFNEWKDYQSVTSFFEEKFYIKKSGKAFNLMIKMLVMDGIKEKVDLFECKVYHGMKKDLFDDSDLYSAYDVIRYLSNLLKYDVTDIFCSWIDKKIIEYGNT